MNNRIVKHGLILAGFALVTTGLISLTFMGTQNTIAEQQQLKTLRTLTAVVPDEYYDNDIEHDCVFVTSEEHLGSTDAQRIFRARLAQQPSAVAIETTAPNGYSGNIHMIVGVAGSGKVTGVRVLAHKETPGLGDKVDLRISDWILSFSGKTYSSEQDTLWAVKKDGGQFDQFTGATITPRAVVNATKQAVIYYQQHKEAIFAPQSACKVVNQDGASA